MTKLELLLWLWYKHDDQLKMLIDCNKYAILKKTQTIWVAYHRTKYHAINTLIRLGLVYIPELSSATPLLLVFSVYLSIIMYG